MSFAVGDKLTLKESVTLKGLPDPPFEVLAKQNRNGTDEVYIETFPYFAWVPSGYFELVERPTKFNWTEEGFKVRAALKKWTEAVYENSNKLQGLLPTVPKSVGTHPCA